MILSFIVSIFTCATLYVYTTVEASSRPVQGYVYTYKAMLCTRLCVLAYTRTSICMHEPWEPLLSHCMSLIVLSMIIIMISLILNVTLMFLDCEYVLSPFYIIQMSCINYTCEEESLGMRLCLLRNANNALHLL